MFWCLQWKGCTRKSMRSGSASIAGPSLKIYERRSTQNSASILLSPVRNFAPWLSIPYLIHTCTDIPTLEICVSTVKIMLECAAIKPSLANVRKECFSIDLHLHLVLMWFYLGCVSICRGIAQWWRRKYRIVVRTTCCGYLSLAIVLYYCVWIWLWGV